MHPLWKTIAVPTFAVIAAWLVVLILSPFDGGQRPFIVFSAAVLVSAWWGGLAPGLIALSLSVAIGAMHVMSSTAPGMHNLLASSVHLCLFIFEGLLISILCSTLRMTRQSALEAQQEAESSYKKSQETVGYLEEARDSLRTSEARLTRLVESNIIGVFVADYDGAIRQANKRFLAMTGWDAESIQDRPLNWQEMTPEEFNAADAAALNELRAKGRCEPYEKDMITRDGKVIPVWIGAADFQDHMICFALDLTKQKATEIELREAKRRAEESNLAKSEFLANTSHELRTPMNAILGMTNLALEENISPEVRDFLTTARESANLLLRLLNDVLDFSKIEAGHLKLEEAEFDVPDVFDETLKSYSVAASEKGLELACHVHGDTPSTLVGDSARLKQVVSNLVSNAIKFTEQGEVIVRVRVKSETKRKTLLHVTVSDTGLGMSKKVQERIFSPFTQADSSTTRRFGGTGLGLAIVVEVITLMGGRVWVKSEEGQGSQFHFTCSLRNPIKPQHFPTQTRNLLARLYEMPALVVDDNPTHLQILQEILSNWSMKPDLAGNAVEAEILMHEKARTGEQYAVVLVDALMPETDGFTVVEKIQNDPKISAKPILMLAAADRQTFVSRVKSMPPTALLEKPISQSDLLDAIVTALDGPDTDFDALTEDYTGRITGRPMRLLIVEDTPANQKVVTAILKRRGHQIEIAQNGREAIECVKQEDYDVVLMDVQMPIMDGFQATAAIRDMSRHDKANTPIIAMTAHAMHGDREKCLAAGMDSYVAKPLDAQMLVETVESFGRKASQENGKSITMQPSEPDAQTPSKAAATFSIEAALKRLGGNRELLNDMIGFFQDDAPDLLKQLESAVAAGEANNAQRAAHSLKGLAANFDATTVSQSASRIETLAGAGEFVTVKAMLPDLQQKVDVLLEHLKTIPAE